MQRIKLPQWRTNAILVETVAELPQWFNNEILYLDLETTSSDDNKMSVNPWHDCQVLGIAVLVDKEPEPYYIPVRHRGPNRFKNLSVEEVHKWLQQVLDGSKLWVNHNIKYDAHVLYNAGITRLPAMRDTIVLAKLMPEVERFTYEMTSLMRDWFYTDISMYEEELKARLKSGRKTIKDYGVVPIDIMCPYACVDTLCVRLMWETMLGRLPCECNRIFEVENSVTQVLFDMENNGMRVNTALVEEHMRTYPITLHVLLEYLEKETGVADFRPNAPADCKEFLVKRHGLPVLEWTKPKKKTTPPQPAFGTNALLAYQAYKPELHSVLDLIIKYKELHKLYTSFTMPYAKLAINGYMHADYNQIVRTGRMSCRDPNMQQLCPEAKDYIIPPEGYKIVDIDFSQIEFRLIAHFIKAHAIIAEYASNPLADYHQIVADLCGIDRYPAKRVNFMLGYGGGEPKCLEILSSIPSIIGELKERHLIEEKAKAVYKKYHEMVPSLRPTTYSATRVASQRGFVRTILNRQRHMHHKAYFKAFNSVIQGSAADLFKAALVRLANVLPSEVKLIGAVHDSFVLAAPIGFDVTELVRTVEVLPDGVELRVPLRADVKESATNWRGCK